MRVLFLLLAFLSSLTGCTSTQTVSRSDSAALARSTHALVGEEVQILMVTEQDRGRLLGVHIDSTRWERDDQVRAEPTSEVRRIVRDTRGRNALRGAGVGVGIGLLLTALAAAEVPSSGDGPVPAVVDSVVNTVIIYTAVPISTLYGAGIGLASGKRAEVILVE